jgi:RNA polymerase sigma factor (TIGR02999 family)
LPPTKPEPAPAGATPPPAGEITALLAAARGGDGVAAEELFRQVYTDLKRIARHRLAGQRADATLSTTALVHEAYLRLARPQSLALADRTHFFAVASRAMRQILVDHARRRLADKRGGGELALALEDTPDRTERPVVELLALDRALQRLAALDERLARVVEWRFFGGLELEQIAEALQVSPRTIKRDWRRARAFLYEAIAGEPQAS